jgi:hypothetical protein
MVMKSKSKRTMGQTKFQSLIDYYLGDMRRLGCTDDSILTNKRALKRLSHVVSPYGNDEESRASLDHVNSAIVGGFVDQLHNRKVRWSRHHCELKLLLK